MTLKEIKNKFLSQYTMSSDNTKIRIEKELNLFLTVCNIKTVEELNAYGDQNISLFYQYSKEHNWNPSTTNLRLQTAKLFFAWAYKKEYISKDFLDDVKSIRTVNTIHYTPSQSDCEKLLQFIQEHTSKKRLYLMTKLLLYTGLRRSELCDLKIDDIDKTNFSLKVLGKGKKIVEQPVPSSLIVELIEYINTERERTMEEYKAMGGKDKGYVFVSGIGKDCDTSKKNLTNGNKVVSNVFYQQLKRYAIKAGIPNADKISCHSIRRTAGTEIYNQTGDIKTASEFLRHSNIRTTENCYINYDKNRLKNAVNERFNIENDKELEDKESLPNNANFSADDEYQLYLLLKKKFANVQ